MRNKILLIQPPWYGFQNISSKRLYLGLAYIGAVLEQAGDQILILNGETFFDNFDNNNEGIEIDKDEYLSNLNKNHYVYERIMDKIKEFSPDIIGISFMTAASSSTYILSNLIKEWNKEIPMIAGGWHPTLLPGEVINKGKFDYAVRGEGEETIKELVDRIKNGRDANDLQGVSFFDNNTDSIKHNPNRRFITNLDSLPQPAFHLVYDFEKQKSSCTGIVTSRGCPFNCTYCASKVMWTQKVRFRSAENVYKEIEYRYHQLGIRNFSFNDDTFTLRVDRVEELCRKIIKNRLKISWHCDTRGDTINLEILKLMKKAGCNHVYLGLETGSPKILGQIKKNIKIETVQNAAALARKAGIETTVYFMIGFPNETEDDIELSIAAMNKIKPDNAIWSILTLYPGTEMWELAKNKGLVNVDKSWDTCFHHFDQGNVFGSISKESWKKMLGKIKIEQEKLHNKITLIKIHKKIQALPNMARLGLKKPKKIIPYFINIAKRCLPK